MCLIVMKVMLETKICFPLSKIYFILFHISTYAVFTTSLHTISDKKINQSQLWDECCWPSFEDVAFMLAAPLHEMSAYTLCHICQWSIPLPAQKNSFKPDLWELQLFCLLLIQLPQSLSFSKLRRQEWGMNSERWNRLSALSRCDSKWQKKCSFFRGSALR